MKIPIVKPSFPMSEEFLDEFINILGSGVVTNGGPYVAEFERQLTAYLGVPTLAFCNGQTALMTMLTAADVKGGEVICPSFTFAATPHAIVWAGATPIFADVEAATLTLSIEDVVRRITPRTKAILGVDPYGICCDYAALDLVAGQHGIKFLVDSAASFGSTNHGDLSATCDAQIFSFHATKAFSTMEGGALSSRDKAIFDRSIRIRNFGQGDGGDCSEPGMNGKMTEVCALIGVKQLAAWHRVRDSRLSVATKLRAGLLKAEIPGVSVPRVDPKIGPIWLYRPIFIDSDQFGVSRDAVAAAMVERGIGVRKYYSPACHLMSAYRHPHYDYCPPGLHVTEQLSANVIALPVHNFMSNDQIEQIVTTLADIRKWGR